MQRWQVARAFVVRPCAPRGTAPWQEAVFSHVEMKEEGSWAGAICNPGTLCFKFQSNLDSCRETRPLQMLAWPGGPGQAVPWLAVRLVWIPGQKEKQKPQELSVTHPGT